MIILLRKIYNPYCVSSIVAGLPKVQTVLSTGSLGADTVFYTNQWRNFTTNVFTFTKIILVNASWHVVKKIQHQEPFIGMNHNVSLQFLSSWNCGKVSF